MSNPNLIPYDQLEYLSDELIAHQNSGGKVKKMWSIRFEREVTCNVDGNGDLTQQPWIDDQTAGLLINTQF